MKNKLLITLLIILIVSLSCKPQVNNETPENKQNPPNEISGDSTCKILFLGSSYFSYNNLLDIFSEITKTAEKSVFIDYVIINGTFLDFHADDMMTESKIKETDWDYVILQGVGSRMAYPESSNNSTLASLKTLHDKIKNNNNNTKIVFCMPWAFEDGMLWTREGTDDFFKMQEKIYHNTLEYSKTVNFIIAPVGWAWYKILKNTSTPHYLHMSDYNHPTPKGTFVMACVLFSTVFQESTVNLPYYGTLVKNELDTFRTTASTVVLDDLKLWKIIE